MLFRSCYVSQLSNSVPVTDHEGAGALPSPVPPYSHSCAMTSLSVTVPPTQPPLTPDPRLSLPDVPPTHVRRDETRLFLATRLFSHILTDFPPSTLRRFPAQSHRHRLQTADEEHAGQDEDLDIVIALMLAACEGHKNLWWQLVLPFTASPFSTAHYSNTPLYFVARPPKLCTVYPFRGLPTSTIQRPHLISIYSGYINILTSWEVFCTPRSLYA